MSEEIAQLEAEIQQEAQEAGILSQDTPESAPEAGDEPTETPGEVTPVEVKMVPHAALHEERERRKAAEIKLREQQERLESRLQTLTEKFTEATTPRAEAAPVFEEDPTGYLKYQIDRMAQGQEKAKEEEQVRTRQAQQNQQYTEFVGNYQRDAAQFSQNTPEFKEAYQFVLQDRDAELQELGFYDPAIRTKIIQNEEIGIVEQAMREGVSPSQRLFNLAKRRGFKAKPAAEQALESIEKVKKGQSAANSLSAVPGKGAVKLNLETLADMSDEEFLAATKGDKWVKMFK